MVEYTRRLLANHEDQILSCIQPGSRIAGVVGLVLAFAPSRGYEGPPPGYASRDGSSGLVQASGGPPYPHGPSNSRNLPSYQDSNLYPPYYETSNSDFRPLDLGIPVPPPNYNSNQNQDLLHFRPLVEINHSPFPEISRIVPFQNQQIQPPVENDLPDIPVQDIFLEF